MIEWTRVDTYVRVNGPLVKDSVMVVGQIHCNKCSELLWSSVEGNVGRMEFFAAKYSWTKPSTQWYKEDHEFHLCQNCYKKMIEDFTHKDLINEPADR